MKDATQLPETIAMKQIIDQKGEQLESKFRYPNFPFFSNFPFPNLPKTNLRDHPEPANRQGHRRNRNDETFLRREHQVLPTAAHQGQNPKPQKTARLT
jgi:hypothetical protein